MVVCGRRPMVGRGRCFVRIWSIVRRRFRRLLLLFGGLFWLVCRSIHFFYWSLRRCSNAKMACCGTTPFPRALICARRFTCGTLVTHPSGSPISHSTNLAFSRFSPGLVGCGSTGDGACRLRVVSHRVIACWYRPYVPFHFSASSAGFGAFAPCCHACERGWNAAVGVPMSVSIRSDSLICFPENTTFLAALNVPAALLSLAQGVGSSDAEYEDT